MKLGNFEVDTKKGATAVAVAIGVFLLLTGNIFSALVAASCGAGVWLYFTEQEKRNGE